MIVSPSDVSVLPIVIPSLVSFAFVIPPARCPTSIEPLVMCSESIALSAILSPFTASAAICPFATPSALIVTAPEVTTKSAVEKEATPLLVTVASSPATVIVVPVCLILFFFL